MKRLSFFLMTIAALVMTAVGCKDPVEIDPDAPVDGAKVVGTFKQAEIVAAASGLYEAWLEDSDNLPASMTVGSTELTQPQYIYALAKTMVDIQAKSTADVDVLSYKMADHPERDSYDQLEIAVFNGPKNGDETEDLGNVAARMIAAMSDKGQVPNQTVYQRNGTNIAFSTKRAAICFLRALSEYAPNGKMPEKVSTDYLSTSATIKGFATEFVKYLDIWENSVCEVFSADGSRNSGNGKPWENVHFVPIPYTGSAVNGDGTEQWDPKFQPYFEPEVAGVKYTAAQCWGIALKSLIDLCSIEGSTVWEVERTPEKPAHTLGNGKSMNSPIPMLEEWFIWGQHPWYENENDGGPVKYNEQPITEVDIAFMMRVMPWHLTRSSQLAAIGNFQQFGTSKESTLYYEGYIGLICPMREFLIAARIFKYILDNDINSNVYDAIKDVKFSFDLYGSEKPDIAIDVDKINFTYEGGEQKVKVTTKDAAWTATVEGEGVTVSPDSGAAGAETEVTITVAPNEGGSRDATVTFTTATGKSKSVKINQGASPTNATIREFATEYVKLIDIWMKTTGTCNYVTGVTANGDENDVENAHYIPEDTKIKVGDVEYNLADAYELAVRSYLLLRGKDGHNTTSVGAGTFEDAAEAYTMDSNIPETHSYTWGSYPFAEPSNGGLFRMVTADGEVELVKTDLLDNYAQRNINWPMNNDKNIANFASYVDRLEGYTGCFSARRALLTYAYFFKYMLDNNLSDAKSISDDQTFTTWLFVTSNTERPTIRAFAEAYVKFIDVWKNTTGTVNYISPTGVVDPAVDYGIANIENAHYIPVDTKLTVAGAEYTTSEVFDIAIRSYLLLRGIDATDETAVGAGSFGKLDKAYTMDDNFLPARPIIWGDAPYNEAGTTNADGTTSGNGGNLKMGTPPNGEDKVKVDLLDNFAERNANFPTQRNNNKIGNMASYTERLAGYYGCASGHRMLLTYAYFFKYMLDNNLSDATTIPEDQTFESYHFGEGMAQEDETGTIKAFAKEYVKLIDVWKNNVGTVNVVSGIGAAGNENDVENAHYIPNETTITVGETEYTLADAVEIASRSYLLLRGYDGNNTEIYGRNLPMPKADKDYTMASDIPATHDYTWGSYPYAERTNGGAFKMVTSEGDFELVKTDLLDDYSQRHTNYPGQGGALSNFCGYTGGYLAGYDGCCCVKRITLAYAYFFKYMLDNNLEDAKGISDDQTFNAPLFEVPAN
ncbi:MAG: BACON domain-containing protein [Bacteroidales bacterium]|nr:BACON domain-containing protein [Bacteroidales bacterium]